jgi:hypothetical protein
MATSTTDNSYRSTESNQEGSLMTDKQIAFWENALILTIGILALIAAIATEIFISYLW